MPIGKRVAAEVLGTFLLVFAGSSVAAIAIAMPELGLGAGGVALAFGLAVVALSYALGHVSGAHFDPAVTVGAVVAQRFPAKDALPYIIGQVAGALLGAATLYLVASGKSGAPLASPANGMGPLSPGGFTIAAGVTTEIVLTFALVLTYLGTTDRRSLLAHAPLAVGLATTTGYLLAVPVTGGSLNPARSTAAAIFAGAPAMHQLWLFWIAPLAGGALAGVVTQLLSSTPYADSTSAPRDRS